MSRAPARSFPSAAYALSGACALVFQVVWYHAFTEQFGASGTTFLVVLCAFIGGLGLGAVSSPRVYAAVERRFGGRGLANYGRTELAVAFASVALFGLTRLQPSALLGRFPYRLRTIEGVAFWAPAVAGVAAKLLLAILAVGVPCFLMGLTFPYLCSLYPDDPRLPSRLYAANTLGASLAVLATEFWGLLAFGYLGCFAAALAGALALGAWFARAPGMPAGPFRAEAPAAAPGPPLSVFPGVLSGFLCGGLQALVYVLVKFVVGPSRGTFALLAFFSIFGIWLASTVVHRIAPARPVLVGAAWLGLAWCLAVWKVEPALSEALVAWGVSGAFASPWIAAHAITFLVTGSLISVPYTLWSLLLPDLCDRQQARGGSLSRTYGFNTLAFLAGVLLFGWVLQYVHVFYAARVFALVAMAGLTLLTIAPREGPVGARRVVAVGLLAALALAFVPRSLEMRLVGGHQAEGYRDGPWRSTPQHLFWVRPMTDGVLALMFDGHSMSGTDPSGQVYMRAMAHLPMLLHAKPENVLLICFGVGITADAIRMHDTVAHVDVVDLNPTVFAMNGIFAADNGSVLAEPRLRLIGDDGRQFLKVTDTWYDFVTMEPPPPLQPGISRLYSLEFYEAVRGRLRPGGIVSQWLPEMQMDRQGVDLITSTFVRAFPHAFLFVGYGRNLILVGSDAPFGFGRLEERLAREPRVRGVLEGYGLGSAGALLSTILRPEESLRRTWGRGPVIRDGFASLDVLQVSNPVQSLHPRSTWRALKPELRYDRDALLAAMRAAAPDAIAEIERNLADPRRLSRTVPPWYFEPGELGSATGR